MQIYKGGNKERTSIQNVVEKIVEPLQYQGQILCFDNFYTYTSFKIFEKQRNKMHWNNYQESD